MPRALQENCPAQPLQKLEGNGTNTSLYDNGRLVTMADGLGAENYSHDQLGRKTQNQRAICSVTYTTGYAYNLAGGVTTLTHPSGRVRIRKEGCATRPVCVVFRRCSAGTGKNACPTGTPRKCHASR